MIETHEAYMNRVATDILSCPKCDSEELDWRGSEYDNVAEVKTDYYECRSCKKAFTEVS
jgi:DNA-directed RNA polymerase subunit M/transcription elongation factor TFIIS